MAIKKNKKTPLQKLIGYLDDEDFRDNFKGRELTKYLSKKFIVTLKGDCEQCHGTGIDQKNVPGAVCFLCRKVIEAKK